MLEINEEWTLPVKVWCFEWSYDWYFF